MDPPAPAHHGSPARPRRCVAWAVLCWGRLSASWPPCPAAPIPAAGGFVPCPRKLRPPGCSLGASRLCSGRKGRSASLAGGSGSFQPPPCFSSALLSASGLLNPCCIQPDTWQWIRITSSVLACPQPHHRLGDLGRVMLPRGAVLALLLPGSSHLLPQRQVLPVPKIVAGDTSVSPECLLRATARPPSDKLRP